MQSTSFDAVIYCRISDDPEGRGLGVERQEQDCRALATRLGLRVAEVFTDNDISASSRSRRRRPRFEEMLERAEAGEFGAILFYSTSRLTRRPAEYDRLITLAERRRTRLASVASGDVDLTTADGIMLARILAGMDEAEANRISERVRRAARQRAEKGQWHGGRVPPLGYELVRGEDGRFATLRLDDHYAPLMRDAARRLLAGESLYSICNDWNHRGLTTREGARWVSATLRRALLSPSSIGRRADPGDPARLYETGWPELLDRQTWDRLHDLMDDPGRGYRPPDGSYAGKRALGGGVTVCAHVVEEETGRTCGKKLVSQVHRGKVRLVCLQAATGGCGRVLIAHDSLERFVLDMVLERLDSPSFRSALRRRTATTDTRESGLREELGQVERRIRGVADALEVGAYDKARAAERVRELRAEEAAIRDRLAALAREHVLEGVESGEDALRLWAEADTSRRRRFLQGFIAEVAVTRHPAGWATTLTRRRGESDDDLAKRREEHERAVLRARVTIRWRE